MDYWRECIEAAFVDAGITATNEQKEEVAGAVEGAHENYGMAHGHDAIPNPLQVEADKLKRKLNYEVDKVTCPSCRGKGREVSYGPHHGSDSECYKCHGEGRIHPSKL